MTTPSSAAALLSAHPLHDMWKENVAGYGRIEGERKLTQTEKVKKKESSCPTSHRSERKEGKRISKIHTPQWRSPSQTPTPPHQRLDISSQSGTTPKARPSSTFGKRNETKRNPPHMDQIFLMDLPIIYDRPSRLHSIRDDRLKL